MTVLWRIITSLTITSWILGKSRWQYNYTKCCMTKCPKTSKVKSVNEEIKSVTDWPSNYVSFLPYYILSIIIFASAGRYTGSYRIPVFIFLTIWIFKIPQYRCHLNNVWNATLLERGLFSLLHFGENTAVCVTKRESSETEALVECNEREEVIHNIYIDRHKYPPSAASAPASLTN